MTTSHNKKQLSEMNLKDALDILNKEYPEVILAMKADNIRFTITNMFRTKCKKLEADNNAYKFFFFDDSIRVNFDNNALYPYSVPVSCYVEAHNRGYNIEEFSDLI